MDVDVVVWWCGVLLGGSGVLFGGSGVVVVVSCVVGVVVVICVVFMVFCVLLMGGAARACELQVDFEVSRKMQLVPRSGRPRRPCRETNREMLLSLRGAHQDYRQTHYL